MLILLLELVFAATLFGVMWGPLGAGRLIRSLLRDESTEIRQELSDVEDKLLEQANDIDEDETTHMLREHYEQEARSLRRRLEKVEKD